eukprot:TRINITY_DN24462_c0_g1_i1.p1 TRINITY_DN24462_c0_g1~~TRINITY_DN24462_c0_g1_i1.p1  ORF type:complete len:156 (-),score=2.15 TRINITY_DN24462_c0_g1_i1:203-670(-)
MYTRRCCNMVTLGWCSNRDVALGEVGPKDMNTAMIAYRTIGSVPYSDEKTALNRLPVLARCLAMESGSMRRRGEKRKEQVSSLAPATFFSCRGVPPVLLTLIMAVYIHDRERRPPCFRTYLWKAFFSQFHIPTTPVLSFPLARGLEWGIPETDQK